MVPFHVRYGFLLVCYSNFVPKKCSFLDIVTTTGCGLVTSPAELLFTYLRVDRTVEVKGISSEFKVGSWNGDACRVLSLLSACNRCIRIELSYSLFV